MTTKQHAAAVEVTVAPEVWRDAFGEAMGLVADCFPRRETRRTFAEMTQAVLMGVERANCWTLAEALGHPGPHRLQHFLARAVWDHDSVREQIARFTAGWLRDGQAVLVGPTGAHAHRSANRHRRPGFRLPSVVDRAAPSRW